MQKTLIPLTMLLAAGLILPNAANAIKIELSSGTSQLGTGATDKGTFTPWVSVNTGTVDFNGLTSGNTTVPPATFGGVTATFSALTGNTRILNDNFAPPGPADTFLPGNGPPTITQPNGSSYLAIFQPNSVTIDLTGANKLLFFGVNFGFFDSGNQIRITSTRAGSPFVTCVGSSVGTCDAQINLDGSSPASFINASNSIGIEQSSYISIFAELTGANAETAITQIQLVSNANTGLETDNYTFSTDLPKDMMGNLQTPTELVRVPFDFSPTFSIFSLAGIYGVHRYLKHRNQK